MGSPEGIRDVLADRYTFERELGRGGMAVVYLAHDRRHDRPVALKVLLPELAASLGPERFQREIRFAARLQHPHILTVLDSGEAAGQRTPAPTSSSSSRGSTSGWVNRRRRWTSSSRCSGSRTTCRPGGSGSIPPFDPLRKNPRFMKLLEGTA